MCKKLSCLAYDISQSLYPYFLYCVLMEMTWSLNHGLMPNEATHGLLATYLIGHNNPINRFRPAATHPFGHLYFSLAYTNRWQGFFDLIFPTDTKLSSSPTLRYSILLRRNDLAEPAQPLDIDMLHNIHVVEELIQLTIGSEVDIIANSRWTEDLT